MSNNTSSNSLPKLIGIGALVAAAAAGAYYILSSSSSSAPVRRRKKKTRTATESVDVVNNTVESPRSTPPQTSTPPPGAGFLNQNSESAKKSYGKLASEAMAKGKFTQALELFTLAIQEADTNHKLYTNRANVYVALQRHADALRDATKSLQLAVSAGAFLAQGAAQFGLDQYEGALQSYQYAIQVEDSTDAHKKKANKGIQDCVAKLEVLAAQASFRAVAQASAAAAHSRSTSQQQQHSDAASSSLAVPAVASAAASTSATEPTHQASLEESTAASTAASAGSEPHEDDHHDDQHEVEFNPDAHSDHGHEELSEGSEGSGVMVMNPHDDAHSDVETSSPPKPDQLAASEVVVGHHDYSSPTTTTTLPASASSSSASAQPLEPLDEQEQPSLNPDLAAELASFVDKKVATAHILEVGAELAAKVGKKEREDAFAAVRHELEEAAGHPHSHAAATAAPAVIYDPATMHPSMLASSPPLTPPTIVNSSDALSEPELDLAAHSDVETTTPPIDSANISAAEEESTNAVESSSASSSSVKVQKKRGKRATAAAAASEEEAESASSSEVKSTPARTRGMRKNKKSEEIVDPLAGPTPLTPPPVKAAGAWAKIASAQKPAEPQQQ